MSARPEWQRLYDHGTFVIWPPDPVRRVVNELRNRYDPVSQAVCEAHITVTQPLLGEPTEEQWRRLRAIAEEFPRFHCDYGPVRSFLPAPVIWLEVQPAERILELRRALHETGLFNLELPHTDDFIPHMTLTEGFSGAKVTEALLEELRKKVSGGSFSCAELSFIVPDDGFRFSVARRLALGNSSQPR